MTGSVTEEELIRLIKGGSKEGFDKLYDNYSSNFYGIIFRSVGNKSVAEDLLQEVFVKIWRNIGKYDSCKGKLYTWMLQIARNTCIDYVRSTEYKNNQRIVSNEADALHLHAAKTEEMDLGLRELIRKLEPKHREVIDKIFVGCYTYDEAAKQLDIPLGTLKTRARNALLILRSSLQVNA